MPYNGVGPIDYAQTGIGSYYIGSSFGTTGRMFATSQNAVTNQPPFRSSWVNSGLDGHGWKYGATADICSIAPETTLALLWMQPSVWNSESALLPIRAWKERPSYKSSLTVDLANARMLRIDNLAPSDILTLGSDKWKVFPWYRKDLANRNGGNVVNHTGTFGFAVRYEGP